MKNIKKIIIVFFFLVGISNGQLLFEENFNYPINDLLTSHNWLMSGTSNINALNVNQTSLAFSGYLSSAYSCLMQNNGQDLYQSFNTVISGSVYLSFLVNVSAAQTGDYFISLSPSTSQTNYFARLHIKSQGTGFSFGISKSNELSGGTIYGTTVFNFNKTYLVVVKHTFVTGVMNDVEQVFVFSSTASTTEPTSAEIQQFVETTKDDPTELSFVTLRQGSSTYAPTLYIGGIRIATNWSRLFKTNIAPSITLIPSSPYSIDAGSNLTIEVVGSDANGDALTYSASSLPTGSTFNPTTRIFTWTPTISQVGTYNVVFTVTDNGGLSTSFTAVINAKSTSIATGPFSTKLNLNNISTFVYNDGKCDISVTGDGGFLLQSINKGIAYYESGLIYGGISSGSWKVGGSEYRQSQQGGRIISANTPENSSLSHVRIYRVRPDYKETSVSFAKEISDEGLTKQQIYDQYDKDWKEWPAQYGAPYKDINNNKQYDPTVDIPGIDGAAQTVWFVCNDLNADLQNKFFGTTGLGIEMQATYWIPKQLGLENVIYKKFRLINKSTTSIDSMYTAYWSDPDLGDASDDLVASDSTLNACFTYNGYDTDQIFNSTVPALGISMLQGPIITASSTSQAYFNGKIKKGFSNLPALGSIAYISADLTNTDPSPGSFAQGALALKNLFRGYYGRGTLAGTPIKNLDLNILSKWMYTGNPVTGEGWNLKKPSDVRMMLFAGPFKMAVQDTQEVIYSQSFNVASTGNRLESLKLIKNDIPKYKGYLLSNLYNIPNNAPTIYPDFYLPKNIVAGTTFRFTLNVVDPEGDASTLSVSSLPSGSSFNTSTKLFSWTPSSSQTGIYTITFTATDSKSASSTFIVQVNVVAPKSSTITLLTNYSGAGSVTGGGIFNTGQTITVTATTNSPYIFTNWTESGIVVSSSASYTFVVNGDRTLVANYIVDGSLVFNRIIVTANANGILSSPQIGILAFNDPAYPTLDGLPSNGVNDRPNSNQQKNGSMWALHTGTTSTRDFSFVNFFSRVFRNDDAARFLKSDYEIRFTSKGSKGLLAFTTNGIIDLPFEVWNIGKGTPNDTRDDYQLCVYINDINANNKFDLNAVDNPSSGGDNDPETDWFYIQDVIDTSPGTKGYDAVIKSNYDPATIGGEIMARLVFFNFNGGSISDPLFPANVNALMPETGTIFRIESKNSASSTFSVVYSINPSNGGSVTQSGSGNYQTGSSVTLTATANNGYTFTTWTENGIVVSTNSAYTFTITSNRNLIANFSLSTFSVSYSVSPAAGGSVSRSGSGTYQLGSSVTLTATPNSGYTFTNWTENGLVVSSNSSYTFNITSNRNLVANFTAIATSYAVAASIMPVIGGSVSGTGSFASGTTVNLVATPNNGFRFANWTENGNVILTSASYSFQLTASKNLTANFLLNSFNLALSIYSKDVTKVTNWKLVGIPGNNSVSLSQIVQGDQGKNWEAYSEIGTNIIKGTTSTSFIPGSGLWIITTNDLSFTGPTLGVSLLSDGSFPIQLQAGWNIISDPFDRRIKWSDVRTKNSWLTENLWAYNGGESTSDYLEPYVGYYLYTTTARTLYIPFIYSTGKELVETLPLSENEITINLFNSSHQCGKVEIGFNTVSKNGFDDEDKFIPPFYFSQENIKIYNPALETEYKNLYKDVRGQIENLNIYELFISGIPQIKYKLMIEEQLINRNLVKYLIDKSTKQVYNFTNNATVTISNLSQSKQFEFIIGKVEFVEEYIRKNYTPSEFALKQNYPNPFNPITTINYSIPKQSDVKLKIYDSIGKEVLCVNEGVREKGYYSVNLDMAGYSSGVYYYQIVADDFIQSKKFVLLK